MRKKPIIIGKDVPGARTKSSREVSPGKNHPAMLEKNTADKP